jgi:hypothetical protein
MEVPVEVPPGVTRPLGDCSEKDLALAANLARAKAEEMIRTRDRLRDQLAAELERVAENGN